MDSQEFINVIKEVVRDASINDTIDITEQQEFVRQAVESGRYERPEDAVQAAMTLWVERERRRAEILAAVDIAKASIDRGDGIEITRESMRALAEHKTTRPGATCRRAPPAR
jgi:Arc/MetJ-type ribon-helix-helix transcriptional regulator